jgi:glycosyltransferase involved in cell wall biosynthesis
MRIAHVNVARNFRGGERQTELLMHSLASRGVQQCLVARRGSVLEQRFGGFDIELKSVSGQLPGVFRALRDVDIVHIHEGRSVYAAWLRRLLSGTPYVVTRRVNNPIRNHWVAHRAYRAADCVVGVAPQVAQIVQQYDAGIRTSVILSSSSGFNPDPVRVSAIRERFAGQFVVGHVGALDNSQKAQDVIIAAARSLRDAHPDIRFVLVGGGSDAAELMRQAAGLDNIEFTGFVDNVGDYLAAFDVFALPSRREGVGSILFDAMNQRLPLIVTPVGGVPFIVRHEENGLHIPVDDPASLAQAILRLAGDPSLRQRLGETGFQMALGNTPDQMAQSYLDLYTAILAGSPQ